MKKKQSYIGIDLHSDNFYAYYISENEEKEGFYSLDNKGIADFLLTLKKTDKVAVEASANTVNFVQNIERHVKEITIVPPNKFSVIGKSTKKTDKNDARTLAIFLSKDLLPKSRIKEEVYLRIISIAETRYILRKTKAALINKLHSIMLQNGHKIGKSKIRGDFGKHLYIHDLPQDLLTEVKLLEKEIKHIRNSMDELERAMISLSQTTKYFEAVRNIKGIGDLSACTIIGVIGNINDFASPSRLASYFGIVPKVRISNSKQKASRITKAGNRLGRSTLVQCTWIAIKYNEELREYYDRLNKTKPSKKAVVATARKLLTEVYKAMKACETDR